MAHLFYFYYYYFYYRLTRVFLKHSRHDYRLQETAAGRRFLQTLRKSQEDYRDRKNGDEGEAIEPPSSSAPFTATSLWDTVDQDDTLELKSSLERLIVEYLKKLSPEEDFETEEYSRLRRHLMDIIEPTIDKEVGDEEGGFEEVEEYSSNEIAVPEEDDSQVEFSDNNHNNNGGSEVAQQGPPRGKRRRVSKKCAHSRRVVSSLNALEIEKAQNNETEKEYNIRRIINYRWVELNMQICSPFSALFHLYIHDDVSRNDIWQARKCFLGLLRYAVKILLLNSI